MKSHSQYICQQCGYKSPSFLGKCPNCGNWNTLVETVEKEVRGSSWVSRNKRERQKNTEATLLSKVKTTKVGRILTGIKEVDQVLGGESNMGLVPGSLTLVAGDPGIGKSTLTLQIIAKVGGLYVSGEESVEQVKLRAERLGLSMDKIYVFSETNIEAIIEVVEKNEEKIDFLVIDSVQTLWSEELAGAAGSIGQVRECTLKLLNLAKTRGIAIFLIGHVTKEGTIAGPKVLEHIVDTVLYLEGDRFQTLRLLRATKNRFGPVDEIGVFSMEERGMKEVKNPSELFLGESQELRVRKPASTSAAEAGRTIIVTLEGSRPLLVEVQALTVASQLPLPRRVGNGINNNRLQMLIAIIQKHLRLPLFKFDIFVNVASGLKVFEPAADLGICLAIISSFKNKPLSARTVAIGEVGLLGEIRNIIGLERRIKEAKKLGFNEIISPKEYRYLTQISASLF